MQNNGTGIHFHGVRQNYTNQMDGVPSITQCPVAPGDSFTYTWRATQYGSSWYHSHFYVQAWDGIFGGILINGPAAANYDEILEIYSLTTGLIRLQINSLLRQLRAPLQLWLIVLSMARMYMMMLVVALRRLSLQELSTVFVW